MNQNAVLKAASDFNLLHHVWVRCPERTLQLNLFSCIAIGGGARKQISHSSNTMSTVWLTESFLVLAETPFINSQLFANTCQNLPGIQA